MYKTLLIFSVFATLPALAAEDNSTSKDVQTNENLSAHTHEDPHHHNRANAAASTPSPSTGQSATGHSASEHSVSAHAVSAQSAVTPARPTATAESRAIPFASGELNPAHAGQAVVVTGKVTEIKTALTDRTFLKLDLQQRDTKPVWVTTFVPIAQGEIQTGDTLVFKGYVTASDSIDATGTLKSIIGSATLLLARTIETSQ